MSVMKIAGLAAVALWIRLRIFRPLVDTSSIAPRSCGLVGPVSGLGVNRMLPYDESAPKKGPAKTIRALMKLTGTRSQQIKRCTLVNPTSCQFHAFTPIVAGGM